MSQISRDPLDLVRQTLGAHHQYPDGCMLFLGTMFSPTQDRHGPGSGFTHAMGDRVEIASGPLGALVNEVGECTAIPPWDFGLRALYASLARRGLLAGPSRAEAGARRRAIARDGAARMPRDGMRAAIGTAGAGGHAGLGRHGGGAGQQDARAPSRAARDAQDASLFWPARIIPVESSPTARRTGPLR